MGIRLKNQVSARMTSIDKNVDPAELAKFSDVAHRWWDEESEFKPLHRINPLRLGWIDSIARLKGRRTLDVGCGGGILAQSMALKGADVLGIDLAAKSLRVAQLHALETATSNVEYREISVESLAAEAPESFQVVTCMEMLEHVPDPDSAVRACSALVAKGGWVFFSTINRNAKAFAFAILGAEYLLNIIPRGTHEYARLIRPNELARSARKSGLEVMALKGLEHNPLSGRYWLSSDTSVNYMMAARKLN